MTLSKVIENIQRGTFELVEDNRQHRADLKAKALEFANSGDAFERLALIAALIESDITGDVTDLEDYACKLEKFIAETCDDPELCAQCNGSGEGQYDGTRCRSCKGTGTVKSESEGE